MHIAIAGLLKSAKSECFWRTAEHFVATVIIKKEPRHTWLKSVSLNPPNVAETLVPSEKKNYRTRGWKIWCCRKKRRAKLVTRKFWCRRKKQLQNTWLENLCCRKKRNCRTREWKILVPSEKKNCRTPREWKILVLSEKTAAEHVAGKCWCGRKKMNWTAKHVTGKFWYRRKKRTRGWKSTLAFEKNICAPPNQIGNFCIMSTNSRRNYCNGMCSQMA